MLLAGIKSFDKGSLRPCLDQKVTSVGDILNLDNDIKKAGRAAMKTRWVKQDGRWVEQVKETGADDASVDDAPSVAVRPLDAAPYEVHGQCYGFEVERDAWKLPIQTYAAEHAARPGYNTLSASEYADSPDVLKAKVAQLARLIVASKRLVVYAGAGLSTAAGIDDYASTAGGRGAAGSSSTDDARRCSPLCAQPTLSHRVLVGLQRLGRLHRLVQQNHDGIPQKAGMPQHYINEIHGALHAPDNPVVPMTGTLRDDNVRDMLELEQSADLCLAVGTSLAGMNADRIFHSCAARASANGKHQLGSVVVGLQRSAYDADTTLRIFAKCDEVFGLLMELVDGLAQLTPSPRPPGKFFRPPFLVEKTPRDDGVVDATGDDVGTESYLLEGLSYDAMGRRLVVTSSTDSSSSHVQATTTSLDLREGAKVVIPTGMHAGACGVVDGVDREGNPRIRFQLKLKPGKVGGFKASVLRPLGTWWMQAALDATVAQLPVVQATPEDAELAAIIAAYA